MKGNPQDALLAAANIVGLYPSILNEAGLKGLREVLDRRTNKRISTNNLVKMAEFVLKNNHWRPLCQEIIWQQTYKTLYQTLIYFTLPDHTKRSTAFSKVLRVGRVCLYEIELKKHTQNMRSWFHERGYPKHLIQNKIENDEIYHHSEGQKAKRTKGVIFVVTYNPSLISLQTSLISISASYRQIKKQKKFSRLDPWLHFIALENLVVISEVQNYTIWGVIDLFLMQWKALRCLYQCQSQAAFICSKLTTKTLYC